MELINNVAKEYGGYSFFATLFMSSIRRTVLPTPAPPQTNLSTF
jgi:hypothetical protein